MGAVFGGASSTVFGSTHSFASAKEAHDFVVETTWGQLADHVILTPGVVTEEMVSAAVLMTGALCEKSIGSFAPAAR